MKAQNIGAVLAGILAVVVLDTGIDAIMHKTGVFPPADQSPMSDALFLVATAYRLLDGIIGGYTAARLAPNRPLRHAFALGIFGIIGSSIGAIATWNSTPPLGPHWYPLALVVIAIPAAWTGGKLYGPQSQ